MLAEFLGGSGNYMWMSDSQKQGTQSHTQDDSSPLLLPPALSHPWSPGQIPALEFLKTPNLSVGGGHRDMTVCWRRSWRRDCLLEEVITRAWTQVDPQARCRQSEAPYFLPCLWNVSSAHHSHTRNHFKDATWRESCGAEIIQMV